MKILHPVESSAFVWLCLEEKKTEFHCLFTDPSDIFHFFRLSLPVLSGDSDVLKMLNAHCFQGDNTFMFYFLD